jgi:hypothetical protein
MRFDLFEFGINCFMSHRFLLSCFNSFSYDRSASRVKETEFTVFSRYILFIESYKIFVLVCKIGFMLLRTLVIKVLDFGLS